MRPPAGNSKWWEVLGQDGFVRERLFPLNASINDHSVELDADVWALIEQNPGIQSLLLRDTGGKPIQLPGKEVMEMLNSGTISKIGRASCREREEIAVYGDRLQKKMSTCR